MKPLPILLDVNEFGELSNRIMDAFERGERTIPTADAMQMLGHIHAWLKREHDNDASSYRVELHGLEQDNDSGVWSVKEAYAKAWDTARSITKQGYRIDNVVIDGEVATIYFRQSGS